MVDIPVEEFEAKLEWWSFLGLPQTDWDQPLDRYSSCVVWGSIPSSLLLLVLVILVSGLS